MTIKESKWSLNKTILEIEEGLLVYEIELRVLYDLQDIDYKEKEFLTNNYVKYVGEHTELVAIKLILDLIEKNKKEVLNGRKTIISEEEYSFLVWELLVKDLNLQVLIENIGNQSEKNIKQNN